MPVDYEHVLSYALPGGPMAPHYNFDCSRDTAHDMTRPHPRNQFSGEILCRGEACPRREHRADGRCCVTRLRQTVPFFTGQGGIGKCSVCGASYIHGDVWLHVPSGEHIHVGHDCAGKYSMLCDRRGWEAWHKEQTCLRSQAAKDKRFKAAALRFLEDKPELKAALDLGDVSASDARYEPVHESSDQHTGPIVRMDEACPLCQALWSENRGGQRTKYLSKAENDAIFAKVTLADMEQQLNKYGYLSDAKRMAIHREVTARIGRETDELRAS